MEFLALLLFAGLVVWIWRSLDRRQKTEPVRYGSATPISTIPIATLATFEPVDQPIGTVDAKQLFRRFMLQTGVLQKYEFPEQGEYFAEEMRGYEAALKGAVDDANESFRDHITDSKRELKSLRLRLAKAVDPDEREELQAEIEISEEELQTDQNHIAEAAAELRAFRADKRAFLVDYINRLTQR